MHINPWMSSSLNQKFYGQQKFVVRQCLDLIIIDIIKLYFTRYEPYGPRQDTKGVYVSVIVNILKNILRNKKPIIFGSGKESFDFVMSRSAAANILPFKKSKTILVLI